MYSVFSSFTVVIMYHVFTVVIMHHSSFTGALPCWPLGWVTTDLGARIPGEPFQVSTMDAHGAMVKLGSMPQLPCAVDKYFFFASSCEDFLISQYWNKAMIIALLQYWK